MIKKTLSLLNVCFSVNANVKKQAYHEYTCDMCHGCGCGCCNGRGVFVSVHKSLRDRKYSEKSRLIFQIIGMIKKYKLPIKYGKNKGIVYFEYIGAQASFHDPKNLVKCKGFSGKWIGRKNTRCPFAHLIG